MVVRVIWVHAWNLSVPHQTNFITSHTLTVTGWCGLTLLENAQLHITFLPENPQFPDKPKQNHKVKMYINEIKYQMMCYKWCYILWMQFIDPDKRSAQAVHCVEVYLLLMVKDLTRPHHRASAYVSNITLSSFSARYTRNDARIRHRKPMYQAVMSSCHMYSKHHLHLNKHNWHVLYIWFGLSSNCSTRIKYHKIKAKLKPSAGVLCVVARVLLNCSKSTATYF